MLNLDPAKLLVIAVVAIILLGPDKLPQVARQVGGAWRSFNEFRHRMETEVRNTMPDLPSTSEIARLARSPSALLDHLSNMGPTRPERPRTPRRWPATNRRRGVDDVPCRGLVDAPTSSRPRARADGRRTVSTRRRSPHPLRPETVDPPGRPDRHGVIVPADPSH